MEVETCTHYKPTPSRMEKEFKTPERKTGSGYPYLSLTDKCQVYIGKRWSKILRYSKTISRSSSTVTR